MSRLSLEMECYAVETCREKDFRMSTSGLVFHMGKIFEFDKSMDGYSIVSKPT